MRLIKFGMLFCLWLAFCLRVWGLDFGFPYALHPDEHQYVDAAFNWVTTGQFETRFINPPLFTYLLDLTIIAWFALSPAELPATFPAQIYWLARLWSVGFGLLTVALLYPLGKRFHSQKAGLLSVVIFTPLFLPVRESHFAVNDALITFLSLLTIYLGLRILKQQQLRLYLMTGVTIGLSTAAKLTGALVVLPLLAAHIFALVKHPRFEPKMIIKPKHHTALLLAGGAAVTVFLAVMAYILWQLSDFIDTLVELIEFGSQGFAGALMGPGTGWEFYFDVFGWGVGWALVGATVIALIYWLIYRPVKTVVISIFPLTLFFYMGSQLAFSARYILPAVPPLVVFVGAGLAQLETQWPVFHRYRWLLWPLVLALLLAQPVLNTIWFNHLLTLPNTQQLAAEWFQNEIAKDTVVAQEPYSVFPDLVLQNKHWPYKVITLDKSDPLRTREDYYFSRKAEIIAVSNFTFDRILQNSVAEQTRQKQIAFLDKNAILLKEFNPYTRPDYDDWFYLDQLYGPAGETLQRINSGPQIKIYRLPYERQPYTTEVPPVSVPVQANFNNKLILLGYDLPLLRAEAGGAFPVTLYWQAVERMDKSYVVFNRLLDSRQQNRGGYDRWPQETANTTLWHPGEIVVDTFNLPVAADAPNGVYTIDIGLYNQADPAGTPLPLIRDGVAIDQNSVRIGPVKVGASPPEGGVSPKTVTPQVQMSVAMGNPPAILLRGYDLLQTEGAVHLTLYWESQGQTSVNWSVFAHLRNRNNETVAQKDGPAGGSFKNSYPTSLWDSGEIIVDKLVIPVPNQLPSGSYNLVAGLYNLADGTRLVISNSARNEINLATVEWINP